MPIERASVVNTPSHHHHIFQQTLSNASVALKEKMLITLAFVPQF